jgi:hypothetical protein
MSYKNTHVHNIHMQLICVTAHPKTLYKHMHKRKLICTHLQELGFWHKLQNKVLYTLGVI